MVNRFPLEICLCAKTSVPELGTEPELEKT